MYEKNLNKIKEFHPSFVEGIENEYIEDFEFCESRQGEKNVKYSFHGRPSFIHSNYSIEKETEKWLSPLNLSNEKVLVIYGIGLGYSFKKLKNWLESDSKNHLLYLEDDPRVIKAFLSMPHAEETFSHPQVLMRFIPRDKQLKVNLFNELSIYFNLLPTLYTPLPHYESVKGEEFCSIRKEMKESAILISQIQDEYLSFGAHYLINFYSIALSLDKSFIGETLQNSFRNIPAIICGAGPSLKKNASFLKTLENKALIFAPGSSIAALNRYGIEPHIGGSGDASPIQYGRMTGHSNFELPMIFKSRMNHQAFHAMHGPRIYSYGNTQYPVLDRIEERLGLKKHCLENGLSMQQHLSNWACFMGCNPIIYVGLDLALTGNRLYSEGVHAEETVNSFNNADNPLLLDVCLEKKDIYGNKVNTYLKWVFEAEQSALFPEKYPNNTFINSTEGGMGIENIPNVPLRTVAEKYLHTTYDLKSMIHTKLQCGKASKVEFSDVINEIRSVRIHCEEALSKCLQMKKCIERVLNKLINKPRSSFQKNLKEFIDFKSELEELPAYKLYIKPINFIRRMTFGREVKEFEADKAIKSENERFCKVCNVYLKEVEYDIMACETQLKTIEHSLRGHCRDGYGSLKAYFKEIMDEQKGSKVKR